MVMVNDDGDGGRGNVTVMPCWWWCDNDGGGEAVKVVLVV